MLTPLPGSEDHKTLAGKGVWMDPDLNKYDLNHCVTPHSKMSDEELQLAYRAPWATYYTPEHVRTILRRATICRPAARFTATCTPSATCRLKLSRCTGSLPRS